MSIALRQYWTLLATYLRPHRRGVVLLSVVMLGTIGLQLLNPQILRYFIDTALAGGEMMLLVVAALLYLGVGLLTQGLTAVANYLGQNVAWSATNTLRADLARHCLNLDMAFHKTHPPGELIERIDGDVNALANFFSQLVIRIFGSLLLLVGVLIALFLENVWLGVALTVFAIIALLVLTRTRNVAVPYVAAERNANSELYGFLEERLAGTEDIRANGADAFVLQQFDGLLYNLYRKGRKAWLFGAMIWPITGTLFAVGYAIALGIGAVLYLQGQITIGTVFLIFTYTELLRQPIEELARQMEALQKAGGSIARIQELMQVIPTIVDAPDDAQRRTLPSGALAVHFEHVTFAYEDEKVPQLLIGTDDAEPQRPPVNDRGRELVLDDINFSLEAGKVLGLLGRTGSGKTTLSRLLFRFYDPTSGVIQVAGADLRQLALADLQNHIGLVTQDVQLFYGTVRDNITFFDRSISDEQVNAVIEDLGLHEWYQRLPDGLDTMLAADGSGLSAGEAQLLAFARVFLKRPGLIIMDEASSRLDPVTEQLIERAVGKLLRDSTGIIIAHRLATVERADAILILDEGRIREFGERAKLAADPNSRLSELLRTGMAEVLA